MIAFSSNPSNFVGIIGNPLSHSLSPIMHNAAFASLKLNWIYVGLPVTNTSLKKLITNLADINCQGINVTIPYKQTVIELLKELSPVAQATGAVNTLVKEPNGDWIGTNTDVEGFMAPLNSLRINWKTRRALVLGCGGSARAVVTALAKLQFSSIVLAGRDSIRLQNFVNNYQPIYPKLEYVLWNSDLEVLQAESFQRTLMEADLVINTTPIGMKTRHNSCGHIHTPLTNLQISQLKENAIIYDLIYTPRPTPLLREAKSRGHHCIDGLEMLVQQGAASFRIWTGIEDVPIHIMRNAALTCLEK